MEETKSGMSWMGVLFFVVILLVLIGGGIGNGFGFGNGWNNRNGWGDCANGGCNRVSNCEVEKQEIIDSARTQHQIEQQGSATRAAVAEGTAEITAQNNRIYIQNLSEKIFDLKMENQGLKSQIYNDAKFTAISQQLSDCCCGFNRRLDGIEANMLTRPNLYGVASTCSGQIIPASFGNNCNSCGSNWNNSI